MWKDLRIVINYPLAEEQNKKVVIKMDLISSLINIEPL